MEIYTLSKAQWTALRIVNQNNTFIQLSFLVNTVQTTPGPSQNMDYITIRCRATTCHECTVLTEESLGVSMWSLRLNLVKEKASLMHR
jgi:hypothetical protein